MKLTNLIWVLALAGSVAACNSGSPYTKERPPAVNPPPGSGGSNGDGGAGGMIVEGCGLTVGTDPCVTEENIAVYEDLVYTNDDGEFSTCDEAASAIGSDCILGSSRSEPPVRGCGAESGVVLGCFPNCPPDVVQAASECVTLCVLSTIEQITGSALSESCGACYGETVACGAAFCTNVCVNDSNAPACIDCRCLNNCIQSFDECSGLPSDNEC